MALVQTRGPSVEPVSLAEAKLHLRVDGTADDTFIASLIQTSRLTIEAALGFGLISQDWTLRLDRWPQDGCVELPLSPALAVSSIQVTDASGVEATVAASDYLIDLASRPGVVVPKSGVWPAPGKIISGIAIAFTAGYGLTANDVPMPLRHAILLLVGHWYENREPTVVGHAATPLPEMISALLAPYRKVRI